MNKKQKNKIILDQAYYLSLLADKIKQAVLAEGIKTDEGGRNYGTINNLAPELSKGASKIKQMLKYDYDE